MVPFFGFELPFAHNLVQRSDAMTIPSYFGCLWFVTVLAKASAVLKISASKSRSLQCRLCLVLGLLLLALGNFFPSLAFAATIGQWLAIINALGILAVSIVLEQQDPGLFNLYNVSGYGDLVSLRGWWLWGFREPALARHPAIVSLLPPVAFALASAFCFIAPAFGQYVSIFSVGYVLELVWFSWNSLEKILRWWQRPFLPLKP